jgi:hypothetical protein
VIIEVHLYILICDVNFILQYWVGINIGTERVLKKSFASTKELALENLNAVGT